MHVQFLKIFLFPIIHSYFLFLYVYISINHHREWTLLFKVYNKNMELCVATFAHHHERVRVVGGPSLSLSLSLTQSLSLSLYSLSPSFFLSLPLSLSPSHSLSLSFVKLVCKWYGQCREETDWGEVKRYIALLPASNLDRMQKNRER